ncbi:GDSL-type esterase/lipase family protein [Sphingomonas abaci]|uniref:SGNH hydrolase-type esterase domain-containing protein n=1 Tax=Sphingomonas abaci TaxID=237611 RepID=A0A7W7AI57_9SPHN|nr:GDSL-type esterase/lipase family protein [Sphingomonas abaci]MBB4617470.1 hypothetical protein [Sphingomonas abaci]
MAIAAAVFGAIVGGHVAIAQVQAARAPLPGAGEPTGACSLWFIGSSTVYKWSTLARDMEPWQAHNRGIDGALIPRIVQALRHEPPGPAPAGIVYYSGENDIARGASAEQTLSDFRDFLAAKTARYGALPVVVLALKPSPTRWSNRPTQTRFNADLRRLAATRHDLHYLDLRPLLLVDGRPGPFYVEDGVHLNAEGYARWSARLRPALAHMLSPARVRHCVGDQPA